MIAAALKRGEKFRFEHSSLVLTFRYADHRNMTFFYSRGEGKALYEENLYAGVVKVARIKKVLVRTNKRYWSPSPFRRKVRNKNYNFE